MIDPAIAAALRGWLRTGEPLELVVATGSMAPVIRPGDQIRVVGVTLRDLHRGDILLLDTGGVFIAHRLLWRDRRLWTRGDASNRFDPAIRPEAVVGKVVSIGREDGWENVPTRYHMPLRLIATLGHTMLLYYIRGVRERFIKVTGL